MRWTKIQLVWLFLLLIGTQSCVRTSKVEAVNLSLIEADELRYLLHGNPPFFMIDVRLKEEYKKGHIKGAVNVWRSDYSDTVGGVEGMMASREKVKQLMNRIGVQSHHTIILYDNKGNPDAARLWWILKQYGHERVVLLNGGLKYWNMRNFELCDKRCEQDSGDFQFEKKENLKWYATFETVHDHLDDIILVDTRSKEEYDGDKLKKGASYAGNVPGSLWIDYTMCYNNEHAEVADYRFKSNRELTQVFSEVSESDDVVVYCHSGVRSAYVTFVLTQLLGYKNVRNYDGSWVEWSKNLRLSN